MYVEVCRNGIYSTSYWKVIHLESAFLGERLEPKLRPCSQNKNIANENQISYLQIPKTVSIGLNILHPGEAPNSEQKKVMGENNFWNFYSAASILKIFSILGAISQIDESKDR